MDWQVKTLRAMLAPRVGSSVLQLHHSAPAPAKALGRAGGDGPSV